MFHRFTERARKVIILAKEEARRLNHGYIGTEHCLLGLIREGQGVAAAVLLKRGISFDSIRFEIGKRVRPGVSGTADMDIPFTPCTKNMLTFAADEARLSGLPYIGTEHLLLGLMREKEGIAAQVLMDMGLNITAIKKDVADFLGIDNPDYINQNPQEDRTPALDQFGTDLTALAKAGKLYPVVGLVNEIAQLIKVLCRRTKNNALLLGEPGIELAVVEGLVRRIVDGNVPEVLRRKRIVALDLALMAAGTTDRGLFDESIRPIIEEVRRSQNIIIFIDRFHALRNAGAPEVAVDALTIIKCASTKGTFRCIGAMTLDEYRESIEKDSSIDRRFQKIMVNPSALS